MSEAEHGPVVRIHGYKAWLQNEHIHRSKEGLPFSSTSHLSHTVWGTKGRPMGLQKNQAHVCLFFPCNSLIASFRNLARDAMKEAGLRPLFGEGIYSLPFRETIPYSATGWEITLLPWGMLFSGGPGLRSHVDPGCAQFTGLDCPEQSWVLPEKNRAKGMLMVREKVREHLPFLL